MRVDKFVMARMNKKDVLELIRTQGPINRAELAARTGLSIPTIMKIMDDFSQSGLITISGKRASTGGKRPELYEFAKKARYMAGMDIGRDRVKCIVMDLTGEVFIQRSMDTGETCPASELIRRLVAFADRTIKESEAAPDQLLGLGIGMPGVLDAQSQEVIFSPDFDWAHVDLRTPFQQAFKMPVLLENANRMLAVGEQWFGAGRDARYMMCINLGHGIGSAVVHEGELYRGQSGSSGEIGHMVLEPNGPLCACGNHGCLEALASGNAIAKKSGLEARLVFEAARGGDPKALAMVDQVTDYIGQAVASVINVFDPECMIFAGGLTKSSDILMPRLEASIDKYKMPMAGSGTRICVGQLGDDGAAIGAAAMVMKAFINQGGEWPENPSNDY